MSVDSPPARATGPEPQRVVVTLAAEIDITNSGQVYDVLARSLGRGATILVADATRTTFCDCTGVSALIRVHRLAAATGAQLRVAAGPTVWRILELTGTTHLLAAHPTVAAALDGDGGQHPAAGNGDSNPGYGPGT